MSRSAYEQARAEYLSSIEKPRAAWDQGELEPAVAYSYFMKYRDMGPKRSLATVSKKVGIAVSRLELLSSRFRWVDRARAWDAMVARRKTEGRERTLEYLGQLDLVMMVQSHEMAARSIARYNRAHRNDTEENPDFKTVILLMSEAIRLSRALRGEATSHDVVEVAGARERLEEILGKYEKRAPQGGDSEPPPDPREQ